MGMGFLLGRNCLLFNICQGLMGGNIRGIGKMESSMEKGNICQLME